MARVEVGETVTITKDGVPIGDIVPPPVCVTGFVRGGPCTPSGPTRWGCWTSPTSVDRLLVTTRSMTRCEGWAQAMTEPMSIKGMLCFRAS
ncbi:type II toxin-antitoxin system Phd/YefM family antitoxin [Streptomyces sp. NPDC058470]|uniref:type II toxin-antitoxin system Phd/YefM family antitoxin n=1 Tax=Streptomyces sp. NPDC058470 TaxID=3346515 RepID=UPI003651CBEF